ncbi:MAG: mucoidy inhibitor MuiA family protein, partial [Bacteroidota bacterium]
MSRFLTLLFILLLCTCVRAQTAKPTEKTIPSTITTATVYLDGAQVNRTAKTTIPAGRATLIFSGLTKDMDPGSIQVKSERDDYIVLSVSHRLNFNELPTENPEAEKVYAEMDALEAEKDRLRVDFKIHSDEYDILKQNRVVYSPQTGLDAETLVSAMTFHRERITAIRKAQHDITVRFDEIERTKVQLQEKISEIGLSRQTKATAEIVVVTQADRAVTDEFTVSYLVPNARWTPHYDVRVADISQPVNLRYRATVSQQTGEDWTNVRLKLSTGDPTASGVAPTLPVWRLYQNARPPVWRPEGKRQVATGVAAVEGQIVDSNGEPLVGATILVPGPFTGTVTDYEGNFLVEIPAGTQQLQVSYTGFTSKMVPARNGRITLDESVETLDEVVVTGYANAREKLAGRAAGLQRKKGRRQNQRTQAAAPPPVSVERRATTVNFDIELPYTIPSDGKARDVEIKRHALPATYTHLSVPKFSPEAYLTAAVTDWEQYDLLSGPINLFFEGTYLGQSALDVATTKDTLELSLGRDQNVIVERKATEDYRKRNFFGNKQSESRGYTITVRNKKAQAINMIVLDQVPVSADEEIEVKIENIAAFKLEEDTGILTWRTAIGPGQQANTAF